MITKEQIKKLKKGDKLIVEVSFIRVSSDNDLVCSAPVTIGDDVIEDNNYFHPSCLSLPPEKPKYDHTRRFKKDDKVRLVPFHGRCPIFFGTNLFGIDEVVTVEEDEDEEYNVLVNGKSSRQVFLACFLELVTPVEEQKIFFYENEPELPFYFVHFGIPDNCELVAHLDKDYYSEKDVQAECDRLNAVYGTEVKHD